MRLGAPIGRQSTTAAYAQLLVDVVAGPGGLLVARRRRRQIGESWLTMPDRGWQRRRTNRIRDRRLFARVLGARRKCQNNSGESCGRRRKCLRLGHDQLRSNGNDGIVFRADKSSSAPGNSSAGGSPTPSSLGITPRFRLSRDTSAADSPRLWRPAGLTFFRRCAAGAGGFDQFGRGA